MILFGKNYWYRGKLQYLMGKYLVDFMDTGLTRQMIVSASQYEFEDVAVDYLDMPGWQTSTAHIRKFEDLPQNAQKYVRKIEELMEVRGEQFTRH